MTKTISGLGIAGTFPSTQAQKRFWFLDQVNEGTAANNIAVQWELRGKFSNASVQAALQSVVDRHEILRTRFVEEDGELVQQVLSSVEFRLGQIDVRSLPEAERDGRVQQIAEDMAKRPFDLSQPCALRVTLVRLAADRAMLLVLAHHAVFDGFSIRVLGREVGAGIAAFEKGEPADLPELAIQYGDYAQWLEACRTGEDFAESGRYWRDRLQDMPYFEIAPDHAPQPLGVRNGARLKTTMPDSFAGQLQATSRAAGTSPFGLGVAAFAAALHRFTGTPDVSFGSVVAGRGEAELEDLIGVFINPVVLRVPVAPESTLPQVVASAREAVRDTLTHGAYPFDELVKDMRWRGDACRTPGVSVFFALQKVFLEEQQYDAVELCSVPSLTPEITHDLNVQIIGRDSGWHMMIDYDADRFDEPTIAAFADLLIRCFDLAFTSSTLPLSEVEANRPDSSKPSAQEPAPVVKLSVVPAATASDAPGDTVGKLAGIWAEVLGLDATACRGDFFDLGGGSLLALRMLARVQQAFGVRPDIATFLKNPTLEAMAAEIDAALTQATAPQDDSDWSLIALRDGDMARPMVVSVNQPFLYHSLAQRLAEGSTVVNLHLRSADALHGGADRLDALCANAASLVLGEAAGRPVVLIGQCVDGTMCNLIAQHMGEAGAPAALLSMIDSWRPGVTTQGRLRRRVRIMQKRLRRWSLYLAAKLRGEMTWTDFFSKNSATRRLLTRMGRIEAPTEAELRERNINEALQAAVRNADIAAYRGPTLLFSTQSQRGEAREILFGWTDLLPADTPVFDLPGWHEDALLKHGIGRIAGILDCQMERMTGDDLAEAAQHKQRARG